MSFSKPSDITNIVAANLYFALDSAWSPRIHIAPSLQYLIKRSPTMATPIFTTNPFAPSPLTSSTDPSIHLAAIAHAPTTPPHPRPVSSLPVGPIHHLSNSMTGTFWTTSNTIDAGPQNGAWVGSPEPEGKLEKKVLGSKFLGKVFGCFV